MQIEAYVYTNIGIRSVAVILMFSTNSAVREMYIRAFCRAVLTFLIPGVLTLMDQREVVATIYYCHTFLAYKVTSTWCILVSKKKKKAIFRFYDANREREDDDKVKLASCGLQTWGILLLNGNDLFMTLVHKFCFINYVL